MGDENRENDNEITTGLVNRQENTAVVSVHSCGVTKKTGGSVILVHLVRWPDSAY